ncbi:S-adenosyl-L-methionine-dependent methyltransferase [Poronia punctata]|nr:S-adenosyl-L-methionine-dependent methyltransferase [Poronia punctata]
MSGQGSASGPPPTEAAKAPATTSATAPAAAAAAAATSTSATPATPAQASESTPATPAPASSPPATTEDAAATAESARASASPAQPGGILPASHWANQPEEEEEFDDGDSAYGGDAASSTASLSASILEYRTVHGRTFHSERGNAQSWNPNDPQHDESMDILHHVSTLMQDGRLQLADLDDGIQKILDVGCGTGIWAIDFADQYPGAEVIGVDISPSQPQWIPPNLKFEVDDITQPWTYAPDSFDYIHMRWLIGAIPDWFGLFKEVYKTLKPGGIFESKEASALITSDDGTVTPATALGQWGQLFTEAGRKFGRTFRVIEDRLQQRAMEAAGFVDIKVVDMKTTLGSWPADPKYKEIGQYARLALEQDVEGFTVYVLSTAFNWTREEIAVYAAHFRRELRSPNYHPYYAQRVVIGRKPY